MYPYDRQFTIQIPGFQQFGPPSGGFDQPPFGLPGGGYGFEQQPPFGPPGYQGGLGSSGQVGPPQGPPPGEIPPLQSQSQVGIYAVDPGGIRRCLYRFTYIRLNNGRSFWFYPTFVGRNSIAGYRWRRNQYRWVYFGIDLDRISSFSC